MHRKAQKIFRLTLKILYLRVVQNNQYDFLSHQSSLPNLHDQNIQKQAYPDNRKGVAEWKEKYVASPPLSLHCKKMWRIINGKIVFDALINGKKVSEFATYNKPFLNRI